MTRLNFRPCEMSTNMKPLRGRALNVMGTAVSFPSGEDHNRVALRSFRQGQAEAESGREDSSRNRAKTHDKEHRLGVLAYLAQAVRHKILWNVT